MKISYVIIHELNKEAGVTGAVLKLYDSINSSDKRVIKLITELNNRYKNRNETYGIFDKNRSTVFHREFDKYYNAQTEAVFIEFSKQSSKYLQREIDDKAPAKGGYLIFAHYEQNRKYLGVFLVRNTIGLSFNTDLKTEKFNVDNVQHIDFENLAMACRISIDSYGKKEIRYMSFINKRGDEMSQYFTNWISATDTENK